MDQYMVNEELLNEYAKQCNVEPLSIYNHLRCDWFARQQYEQWLRSRDNANTPC